MLIIFISIFLCINIFFWNIDKIINFYLQNITIPIFMTDRHILSYHYFNSLCFYLYSLYVPFICIYCLINTLGNVGYKISIFYIRLVFSFIYIHCITLLFNYYDFIDSTIYMLNNLFSAWRDGIDLISLIKQYQGFYWDVFYIFGFFYIRLFRMIENYNFYMIINYNKIDFSNFWITFISIWGLRCYLYFFSFYFFCGNTFMIDLAIIVFTFCCVEFLIISYRVFYKFKTVIILIIIVIKRTSYKG
jgi:hypothetical protein